MTSQTRDSASLTDEPQSVARIAKVNKDYPWNIDLVWHISVPDLAKWGLVEDAMLYTRESFGTASRDAESAGTQRVVAHYDPENDRVVTASQMASLLNHQGKPGQAAARTYTLPLCAPTAESTGGAKDNAVQQARQWAQEARTQRAIVLDILRYFGLPERDWEALRLIREKLEGATPDSELPGMWQRADFEGGQEEVRGPDWMPLPPAPGQSFTATQENDRGT